MYSFGTADEMAANYGRLILHSTTICFTVALQLPLADTVGASQRQHNTFIASTSPTERWLPASLLRNVDAGYRCQDWHRL
jgi:hypothetical protein